MTNGKLAVLIPAPKEIRVLPGELVLNHLRQVAVAAGFEREQEEMIHAAAHFGLKLEAVELSQNPAPGVVTLQLDADLAPSAWHARVTPEGMQLRGGDGAGVLYAATAAIQWIATAAACGIESAKLECGEVKDAPRFSWRGLMLDSARHFQSVPALKQLLRSMAALRLNVLHWHLTDGQGWRIASEVVPDLAQLGDLEMGQYSVAELREIAEYSSQLHIRIVPELDMPGHSSGLLRFYPQYACNPQRPGSEFCLAKPEVKQLLTALLREVADIFPNSPILHLGGDEAGTEAWSACPCCQAAMKRAGYTDCRQLEAEFMNEMAKTVLKLGRTPMVWSTETAYPPEVIVQAWFSLNDFNRIVDRGNPTVNSVHTGFYLDYPENAAEPAMSWMPLLSDEGVYQTTPTAHWGAKLEPLLLGVEACLWTEWVPEWRLMEKLFPRLTAVAEVAWVREDQKDYADFNRRRRVLSASGYVF